jgi:NitT/TauT family transport system substrate-binding protein
VWDHNVTIRLMENFRAVFYAPYYAAHSLGFYQREGVEVELIPCNAPGDAIKRLLDDAVDLTWGGPMRVMAAHDRDPASSLVSFAEMVARDPFFLIGSGRPFRLADLQRLRFASVSEVPTPWMCLQHDLRELGFDPEILQRISLHPMADNYAALRRGELDVIQAFEPYVAMAERDGAGEALYAASSRGPTVYTAFIATRAGITRHRAAFAAMTRAIAKLEQWLYANGAEKLAEATTAFLPDVPYELLLRSLQRYRDAGLWAREPKLSRQGFDRLGQSFLSGGALNRLPVYDECVSHELQD